MTAELLLAAAALAVVLGLLAAVVQGRGHLAEAKRSVEERERRYRSLFESSLAGIALVAADGNLIEWNSKLPQLLGVDVDAPDNAGAGAFQWQEQAAELARIVLQKPTEAQHVTSLIAADGSRRWIEFRHWPMDSADSKDGKKGAFWLLAYDITRRRETHTLLRLAQRTYECVSEAILVTDVATRIVDVNPAFEQITGYSRQMAVGMRASLLRSDHHESDFFDRIWAQLNDCGSWKGEIWNRCSDGRVIPCWMHIDAIRDPQSGEVTHYVGVFSDISERKMIEERISFLAHHDPLTGLANRFSLDVLLPQAISMARRQNSRVALLFVDLDRFKEVNDKFGHAAGDQVLVESGRRLVQSIRDSDFLARIGGDEFVVLLNEIGSNDDALRVAMAIHESLRAPMIVGGSRIVVTPSIGISLFPDDGDEADTLLARADDAMYQVKSDGRDSFRFYGAPTDPPA